MSHSGGAVRDTPETHSQRERIRSHMKMVIGQLEGILCELQDVAKELREVVGQIDKLTSDFDFDQEPDDWTVATASSTSSSERGLGEAFRLDFLSQDMLSDSWEFCSFLEASSSATCRRAQRETETEPERVRSVSPPPPPAPTASVYSQMNGGLPIPNGPLIVTPDSSSEEASSSTHSQKTSRTSGTRERVRFSDKILYHALCCDDDDEDEEEERAEMEEETDREGEDKRDCGTPDTDSELSPLPSSPVPPSLSSSHHPFLHNCVDLSAAGSSPGRGGLAAPTLPRKSLLTPGSRRKALRNSSTQTVSDKSTQTVLPYVPAPQKTKDH